MQATVPPVHTLVSHSTYVWLNSNPYSHLYWKNPSVVGVTASGHQNQGRPRPLYVSPEPEKCTSGDLFSKDLGLKLRRGSWSLNIHPPTPPRAPISISTGGRVCTRPVYMQMQTVVLLQGTGLARVAAVHYVALRWGWVGSWALSRSVWAGVNNNMHPPQALQVVVRWRGRGWRFSWSLRLSL